MKHSMFRTSVFAVALSVLAIVAAARQAAPLLPPLRADAAGQLKLRHNELIPAEYGVAVAAAAQATNTDPAFLFALAARLKFAAVTYGASAEGDPDAPVGGPYAYGSVHWLSDLAAFGKDAGYPELAMAVVKSPTGVLEIVDAKLRFRAMTARTDPYLSSFLAAKAWQQARKELEIKRAASDGLVMIAFLSGVHAANSLAERSKKDRKELLKWAFPAGYNVLLTMTGLPARDVRNDAEWTIGNFIDEVTDLIRTDTSAYSAARRIDVPDGYLSRKPMS